jgi:hypothetical protein
MPRIRKRFGLIAVGLALASLAFASRVYGQSPRPFEITPDTAGPISLDWSGLTKDPKVIGIANNTLKGLKLRVDLGGFTRDGKPVDLSAHLGVDSKDVTLPAAGIVYIRIRAANATIPSDIQAGSYTGFLTISESSNLLRKQVTILSTVPPKPSPCQLQALVPSGNRLVVRVWRQLPSPIFSNLWGENFRLPLREAVAAVSPGTPRLSYLSRSQGGGGAFVRLNEKAGPLQDEQGPYVQLTLEGVNHAGQYDGTISLSPRPAGASAEASTASLNPAVEQNITVSVTDIIVWPILVIVLGILITQVTKYYFGVKRQIWSWRQSEAEVGVSYKQAKQEFSATAGKHNLFTVYSIEKNLTERRKEILDRIQSIDKLSSFSLQDDAPAHNGRSVTDELAGLSAKVLIWAQFPINVIRLRDEMVRAYPVEIADAKEPRAAGPRQLPKIISQCGDAMLGGSIDVDAIECRGAELKAWAAVLTVWGHLYRDFIFCYRQILRMKACDDAAPAEKKLSQEDRDHLGSANQELEGTLARLWEVEAGDDKGIEEIEASLTSIQASLRSLDARLKELGLASDKMSLDSVAEFPIVDFLEAPPTDVVIAHQVTAYQPLSLIARIRDLNNDRTKWRGLRAENDESRARYYRAQTLKWDRLTVGVAALITIITALQVNYFGAAFGSLKDYATLFVWAVGSQSVIEAFSGLLGRVFSSFKVGVH